MRFLLDESTDLRISDFLTRHGHDVTAVGRTYPSGLSDTKVLATALSEGRILITNDKDFGELVFRHGFAHEGVIFFRLGDAELSQILERLGDVLIQAADHLSEFIVVTQQRIRARSRP